MRSGRKWTWRSTSPSTPVAATQAGTSASSTGGVARGARAGLTTPSSPPLDPPTDDPLGLALRVALGHRLALVVLGLAAREGELDLAQATGEVERQRDEGVARLAGLADEPRDLRLVQQQLADAPGLVVGPGAEVVLLDVQPAQEDLAVGDQRERVVQRHVPGPQ